MSKIKLLYRTENVNLSDQDHQPRSLIFQTMWHPLVGHSISRLQTVQPMHESPISLYSCRMTHCINVQSNSMHLYLHQIDSFSKSCTHTGHHLPEDLPTTSSMNTTCLQSYKIHNLKKFTQILARADIRISMQAQQLLFYVKYINTTGAFMQVYTAGLQTKTQDEQPQWEDYKRLFLSN